MNAPHVVSGMQASQDKIGTKADPSLPTPEIFNSVADERIHRKQRLAAGFRLFSKMGFDEGIAGHITARDLLGQPLRRSFQPSQCVEPHPCGPPWQYN